MSANGGLKSLDAFEEEYSNLDQDMGSLRQTSEWLRTLKQLTCELGSDIVVQGIAYGSYLERLERGPRTPASKPSLALLFETSLPSMYDAAVKISEKIITPFFIKFGYFPYFQPWTREVLEEAKREKTEVFKNAFRHSSVRFFP